MKRKLSLVVGARPNFIKALPLMEAIRNGEKFEATLIHTGQHFDENMSEVFFNQLGLPKPDRYLDIHGGGSAEQIGRTILALETELRNRPPKLVVVFGDVNSTLAAAVVANKLGINLAHIEAGLRSFDRSMPEEHNRVVTDLLSDLLFTPSRDANQNLINEGVSKDRIHFVGNIMVDSLLRFRSIAENLETWTSYGERPGEYGLVTLHRPSNVDRVEDLAGIIEAMLHIQKETPLIFPVHPRSRKQLEESGFFDKLLMSGVQMLEPLGYLDFLSLMIKAKVVLTDSGGIQEETTVLGVPCLTLRNNTERPITIELGTNRLVGTTKDEILAGFREALIQSAGKSLPELWDGKTAERIERVLSQTVA